MKIIENIKNEWNKDKLLFIAENLNMIFTIFAATCLSFFTPNIPVMWHYVIFGSYTFAACCGVFFSIRRKSTGLLILNVYSLIFSINAIIRQLLV